MNAIKFELIHQHLSVPHLYNIAFNCEFLIRFFSYIPKFILIKNYASIPTEIILYFDTFQITLKDNLEKYNIELQNLLLRYIL